MAKLVFLLSFIYLVGCQWYGMGWNRLWEERSMLCICYWQRSAVWLWMCYKMCTYMCSYELPHINFIFLVEVFSFYVWSVFLVTWMYILAAKHWMCWVTVINMKWNFGHIKSFIISSGQVKWFFFKLIFFLTLKIRAIILWKQSIPLKEQLSLFCWVGPALKRHQEKI